jgi:hypothetical protein
LRRDLAAELAPALQTALPPPSLAEISIPVALDAAFDTLDRTLLEIAEQAVKRRSQGDPGGRYAPAPWWNNEVHEAVRAAKYAARRYKRTRDPGALAA